MGFRQIRLHSIANTSTNVTMQAHKVTREERCASLGRYTGHRGCTIWFTGLSGAGKTTISFALERTLIQLGIPCYGLDGDNVRHGLCNNLNFSDDDRRENIRRVAEVAKLFADMGIVVLASFISPFAIDRENARKIHEKNDLRFFEIYVSTPLSVCEERDPKKLYQKARSGKISGFTGIDSTYEAPVNPDFVLNTSAVDETQCVQEVLKFLFEKEIIPEQAMHQLCTPDVRELFVTDEKECNMLRCAVQKMPRIDITLIDLQWLQVLAEGWATPLPGFMRERQYLQTLHHGQIFDLKGSYDSNNNDGYIDLVDPINQSVPIVLPIDNLQKESLYTGNDEVHRIALYYDGVPVAVLMNPEVYAHRKAERIHRQFGYLDSRHPAIKLINDSGDWLLGGEVKVLDRIKFNDGLDEYRKTPMELREHFAIAGCDVVFAFQLRNPIHNGHVLLMQQTREKLLEHYRNPMLLLHPLGGWTKDDDVPLSVRIDQHKAVVAAGVLDKSWTQLAIFPSPMLYAGPTEVQWHARARMAAGVNAYIVGRDPAGIQNPETGDYLYEPTHGAKVLSMAPGLQNLEIIPFRVAAYDKTTQKMAFFDPSRKDDFLFISGSAMRKFARSNEQPPDGFMVPEAWKILASHYAKIAKQNEKTKCGSA